MLYGNSILMITVNSVIPFVIGSVGVWLYYRNKFTEVLTELEDKKAIIAALANHSDEQERQNVKKVAKQHNAKVDEKKVNKPKKTNKKSI